MKNQALGSSLDDFLAADGLLEEVTEATAKRVLARSAAAATGGCVRITVEAPEKDGE